MDPTADDEPVDSDYKGPTYADNRPIRWSGDTRAHLAGVLEKHGEACGADAKLLTRWSP